MPTDAPALLTLAQWLSPAFPVGAFSYSHGLEWAVEAGDVTDAGSFQAWLGDILVFGTGRNDAILLVAAYRAGDRPALQQVDELARALAPSRERLAETALQGAAFARTVCDIWPLELPDLTYPVALGAAARLAGLPLADTALFYLHGFAGNLTSAATRLVPLGQTEAQAALAAVAPVCKTLADQAQDQSVDDLGACTFMADIASMKHETQYSRLFQS
jgi:urease accessory protein